MKGCAGGEEGEDCCRWSHVGKKLSGVGLSESAAPSRDAQYHETVRVDVEVLGLIGESVSVQSSDVTLLYVHVETMLCKYWRDRWCDVEHQRGRSHYLSVILVRYHVAGPK